MVAICCWNWRAVATPHRVRPWRPPRWSPRTTIRSLPRPCKICGCMYKLCMINIKPSSIWQQHPPHLPPNTSRAWRCVRAFCCKRQPFNETNSACWRITSNGSNGSVTCIGKDVVISINPAVTILLVGKGSRWSIPVYCFHHHHHHHHHHHRRPCFEPCLRRSVNSCPTIVI